MYMFPGFAVADEVVLCVSADGRVSVEEAMGGRCLTSHDTACSEPTGREEGSCPAQPDCCGSCLDLPVSVSSTHDQQVPAAGGLSHDAPPAGPCGPVHTVTDDFPASYAGSPGVNPVARSALKILRTAVLII